MRSTARTRGWKTEIPDIQDSSQGSHRVVSTHTSQAQGQVGLVVDRGNRVECGGIAETPRKLGDDVVLPNSRAV